MPAVLACVAILASVASGVVALHMGSTMSLLWAWLGGAASPFLVVASVLVRMHPGFAAQRRAPAFGAHA